VLEVTKELSNEASWRQQNLPPYHVPQTTQEDDLARFAQQQSTQQAARYKKSSFNPLGSLSWAPGEPYVPFPQNLMREVDIDWLWVGLECHILLFLA
jgi:hypothetical protein